MLDKIKTILDKAQESRGCHQREVKVLKKLYQESTMEDMFACIQVCVQKVFLEVETSRNRNDFMEKVFDFLAKFVGDVTPLDSECDSQSSAFLSLIVKDLLQYFTVVYVEVRYGACLFMNLILKHLGNEKTLDCDLCDMIQEALLKCVEMDIQKIRLQAVLALVRLQNPGNSDCPVIKAYLSLFVDPYSQIRMEIVKSIAPISITLPEIVNRLWDTEPSVRIAAFRRCGDLGINSFKIVDRRKILNAGLCELQSKVKNVFTDYLLQKWLHFTEDNIMKFLYYIRLDADENDINMTEDLSKQVINILLESTPVKDLFSTLPLNDEKLIPTNALTVEAAILWNILVQHFRKENDDDFLEQIIPELTPFCNNIERFIIEKNKQKNDIEEWVFLTNQCILYNLFEIVEGYDLADEVGRRNLFILTEKLLKEGQLQFKLKKKTVELAYKATTSKEDFTSIICHLISEIREPFEQQEVEIDNETKAKKDFEKAQLRVKIIRLNVALENATETQNFLEADSISRQINELELKHKELSDETNRFEMVKVSKNDTKTICDCLDILVCLLELASTKTITPSLRSVKDEFVVPLLKTEIPEINWRVIRVLILFCLLEEALLEEFIKICYIPIITYRTLLQYDKNALKVSLKGICDFVRLYGTSVFSSMTEGNISNASLSQKRRLYNSEDSDESIRAISTFSFQDFLEILADILDDEDEELRNISVLCITKLTLNGVFVSNTFITRLILKWCNPATKGLEVQQMLGVVISNFATKDNNKEIIGKSVIPIFEQIVGAPINSPLKGIDCEKLIEYLTWHTDSKTILTPNNNPNVRNLHLNMAQMFIIEMSKKKNAKIAPYLCKMLTLLDINTSNYVALKEMKVLIGSIINDNMLDRKSLKHLNIFKDTVIKLLEKSGNDLETIPEENEDSVIDTGNNENLNTDVSNIGNGELFSQTPSTSTKKRRRNRNSESGNTSINNPIETPNKSAISQPSKKTKLGSTNNINNPTIDQETKTNTSTTKVLDNPTIDQKTRNKNLVVVLDSQIIRLPNKSNEISEKASTETVNEKNINDELENRNSSIDIISATTSEQSQSPSKRNSSDENSNSINASPPQSSSEITNSKQKKPKGRRKRKRNQKSSRSSSANSSLSESSKILKRPNIEETSQINSEKDNRNGQHKKMDKNVQQDKNEKETENNHTNTPSKQIKQKKRSRRLLSNSSDSNKELIINNETGTKKNNEEGSKQRLTRNGSNTVEKGKAIENVQKKRYSNDFERSNSSIDIISATPSEQSKSSSKSNSPDENINSNNVLEKEKENNNNTSISSKQNKRKNRRLFSSSSDSNEELIIKNKIGTKENNKEKSKNTEGSTQRLTRNGNKTVEKGKATVNVQKKRYSNDLERSNSSIDIVSATPSEQSKSSSKRNSSDENINSNNVSEKGKENNNTNISSKQNKQKKRRSRRRLSNSSDSNEELIINNKVGNKENNKEKSKNAERSTKRLTRNGNKTVEKGKATENVYKKRYSNNFKRSNSSIDIISATPSEQSKSSSKRNSSDENINSNNGLSSRLHGSLRKTRSSKVDFNETTLHTIIHDESMNLSLISNSSFGSQISEHNSTYSASSNSSNARRILRSLTKKKNIE